MKTAALKYLQNGFNVIPAGQTKKALIEWKPYQTERVTETLIDEWWGKWPKANIAIITGAISGIMAVDVDTEEGLEAINEFLSDTFLTPTYTTPSGGRHYWFRYRPGLASRTRVLTGCDVRTDGGYIVVPPSKNGQGKGYAWLEGLSLGAVSVAEMPGFLFDTLAQFSDGASAHRNDSYTSRSVPIDQGRLLSSTSSTFVNQITFTKGTRDDDLFHVANALVKGGMRNDNILKVLNILARNCDPPFPENDVEIKVKSAIHRGARKERNISQEVRDWALSTSGYFSSTQCLLDLLLSTRQDKLIVSKVMAQLVNEGVIERFGNKHGQFRKIEGVRDEMKFIENDISEFPVRLPFGLNDLCVLYPKNIVVIAGTKSSGKTALLLDIAIRNMDRFEVVYLNSEMGDEEWSMRLKNKGIRGKDDIKFKAYNCHANFHDLMDDGKKIFIVDYLEIHDNFFEIAKPIRLIHEKIKNGICFISVQKKINQLLGRGAEFSMEKSRLYLSMDYLQDARCTKLTVVDAKASKLGVSVAGFAKRIKIYDGAKMECLSKDWER